MQSYNPPSRDVLSQDYWMVAKHVNKNNADKPFVYIRLLLLLKPSVMWLSIVTFNNDAKPPPMWILRKFDVSRIPPRLGGLPHLETFTWQNLTPSERVTRSARPGYLPWWVTPPIMVIKLKWEVIWIGELPHLSGLPHLPGVPHLHVNRPLDV